MKQSSKEYASIFQMDGIPKFSQALPLALQHVVAMIVGCVTPAIIVSNVANLSTADRVILIQAALVVSALSTLLQLFPIGKKNGFHLGAALPVIMGISFAYVPSMQSIAADYGVPAILGAQIVGGVVAFIVGAFVMQIRKFFPPLITGTVVFTIGLSLYPTAINYMAGGTSSPTYGSWQNWGIAFLTLVVVTVLNHFGKGIFKLASILIGIIVGYVVSLFFGMVDFASIGSAAAFQVPQLFILESCLNRLPVLPLQSCSPSTPYRRSATLRQLPAVLSTVNQPIRNFRAVSWATVSLIFSAPCSEASPPQPTARTSVSLRRQRLSTAVSWDLPLSFSLQPV